MLPSEPVSGPSLDDVVVELDRVVIRVDATALLHATQAVCGAALLLGLALFAWVAHSDGERAGEIAAIRHDRDVCLGRLSDLTAEVTR